MAYLTLSGINKIYPNGFHAVHDFNLEIDKGEFIVFFPPYGAHAPNQTDGEARAHRKLVVKVRV